MDMSTNKQLRPFGMRDKIGYAFGDFGCNMSFAFINSYLMLFYVTCMKIDPKHFAVLILLGKIFDAINDPIIGGLCDATKPGKDGKFKPWIKWASPVLLLLPSDWSRPQLGCSGGCVQPLRWDFPCRWHIVSEPGISWKPKRYSVKQLLPRLFSVRCWLLAVFVSAVCFLSGWVETRRYGTIRPSTSEYSHYSCLPCS